MKLIVRSAFPRPHRLLRLLSVGAIVGSMAWQSFAYCTNCSWPIVVQHLKMEDVTLEEAVQCLRDTTRLEDKSHDPKGVNFVIKDPQGRIDKSRRLNLEVFDVKLADVVNVLGAFYGVRVKTEPYAIVFEPKTTPEPMMTRYFKVPPNFRSSANVGR